jgi:hypothetical protein
MGVRYVGLGYPGIVVVLGDVRQQLCRGPVAPSLDASPFLAGGQAEQRFRRCV